MRTAAVLMVLALAGCNLLRPPDLERVDKRAETPEAVAAEMGWRADSFVFDEHGVVAYASRVRDGTLEIAAIEQTGGEWVATMGGDWDDLGDTNTVAPR